MEPAQKQIVFISWKDIRHPAAGGAELIHQELSKRLVRGGHKVIHLVPGFKGAPKEEMIDGITVIRVGSNVLAFYALPFYFLCRLKKTTTHLVDVFNCFGSFACLFFDPQRTVFSIYHVQDRMWFYQTSFYGVPRALMPFINIAGYVIEKIQLTLLALLYRGAITTISHSTADEISRYGFSKERIRLITVGIAGKPLASLADSAPKEARFTVLMIGPRLSKRPMETLKAFAMFHERVPESVFWVAGWGTEEDAMRRWTQQQGLDNVVQFWGRVSDGQRNNLLQRCHVLCTTPVKEGWGLIVVEANAMGTPAIGYDVPGLREALSFDNGMLCAPEPRAMADALERMHLLWRDHRQEYEALRARALAASRELTFDRCYEDFSALLFRPNTK